jgi:hypothetical protein
MCFSYALGGVVVASPWWSQWAEGRQQFGVGGRRGQRGMGRWNRGEAPPVASLCWRMLGTRYGEAGGGRRRWDLFSCSSFVGEEQAGSSRFCRGGEGGAFFEAVNDGCRGSPEFDLEFPDASSRCRERRRRVELAWSLLYASYELA